MSDQTHYAGCWQDERHHACALREIERLRADQDSWAQQADDRVKDCEGFIADIERLCAALRPFAALPVLDLGQCQRHPEERVFAINGTGFTANDVLVAKEALGNDPLDN